MSAKDHWQTLFEQVRGDLVHGNEAGAEHALHLLEEKLRAEKDPLPGLRALIEALFMMEHYEPAVAACDKVLSKDPNDARAHELLAQIYYFQERYEPALHHAEKALSLDSGATLADGVRRHIRKKRGLSEE